MIMISPILIDRELTLACSLIDDAHVYELTEWRYVNFWESIKLNDEACTPGNKEGNKFVPAGWPKVERNMNDSDMVWRRME